MALEYSIHQNVKGIAVTGIVGAAPITVAGNTISIVSPEGTGNGVKWLSARIYAKATTALLTITAKWQVSQDGTTWYDVKPPNNAAHVILVTASASTTVVLDAPEAVYTHFWARLVAVSGAAVGNDSPDDEVQISYNYQLLSYPAGG